MLTTDYGRTVRVAASVTQVWEEIGDLDRLVGWFPEVASHETAPDRHSAGLEVALGLGSLAWRLRAEAEITDLRAPHRLTARAEVPRLRTVAWATMELTTGGADECILRYSVVATCRHRVLGRWSGTLTRVVEDHVDAVVARLSAAAARHAAARRHLAPDRDGDPGGDGPALDQEDAT